MTLLGLFDLVIASDKATFVSPFTRIAQSPEACSSYTFPRMMGRVKASEFLMFNRKLTAQEAYERNLVSHVIPHGEFSTKAWEIIEDLSKLPPEVSLFSFFSNYYIIYTRKIVLILSHCLNREKYYETARKRP